MRILGKIYLGIRMNSFLRMPCAERYRNKIKGNDMLQLMGIGVGVAAVVMGVIALAKGEIQLSAKTTLRNGQAKIAGVLTIILGILIGAFFLIGIPLLRGR